MPFIDTSKLDVLHKRPGWRGRVFHSASNTFVWWEFDKDADIHGHSHAQEEVWHIIEGELAMTIAGVSKVCGPGSIALIPPETEHSARALTPGRAIVVDHPVREGF